MIPNKRSSKTCCCRVSSCHVKNPGHDLSNLLSISPPVLSESLEGKVIQLENIASKSPVSLTLHSQMIAASLV